MAIVFFSNRFSYFWPPVIYLESYAGKWFNSGKKAMERRTKQIRCQLRKKNTLIYPPSSAVRCWLLLLQNGFFLKRDDVFLRVMRKSGIIWQTKRMSFSTSEAEISDKNTRITYLCSELNKQKKQWPYKVFYLCFVTGFGHDTSSIILGLERE